MVRAAAITLDWDALLAQEAVVAHLVALHGWAQLADQLPPSAATGGNLTHRAWILVDELLFGLLRCGPVGTTETVLLWAELLDLCASAAVDVLGHLRSAMSWELADRPHLYVQLVDAYLDQVRRLLEWGLCHRERILATLNYGPPDQRVHGLLSDLARLGIAETIPMLQAHVTDPDIGPTVVAAIRAIEARTG